MTKADIKKLKKRLKRGDYKLIADECKVEYSDVRRLFNNEYINEHKTGQIVVGAVKIIESRKVQDAKVQIAIKKIRQGI